MRFASKICYNLDIKYTHIVGELVQNDKKSQQIDTLNKQVETLTEQSDNLKKQVETLTEQNEQLKKENQQIESLKKEVQEIEILKEENQKIESLKKQFNKLLDEIEYLKKDNQQIATLKQEKESLIKQTQNILSLQSQIGQLKNLLEDKENALKEKVDELQFKSKQIQNFEGIYEKNKLRIETLEGENKILVEKIDVLRNEQLNNKKEFDEQLNNKKELDKQANNEKELDEQPNNQHNVITIVSLLLMGAALHYLCNRIFNGLSNTNLIKAPDTSLVTSISKKAEFILNNTKDLSLKI